MKLDEIRILGIKVHKLTMQSVLDAIGEFVEKETPHLIVTLGTEMIMRARQDEEFRNVLENADLLCADAVGILWASGYKGDKLEEKVAGVDLLENIVKISGEKQWNLFFLGAAEGVAALAAENLRKKYPDANISGVYHGFFRDDSEVEEMLLKARPHIIFVALGSPKQELWYKRNAEKLRIPVGIGVGGSFDIFAGKSTRAPKWMIGAGLEWLYRLYKEPWRWKRMLVLPRFVAEVVRKEKRAK